VVEGVVRPYTLAKFVKECALFCVPIPRLSLAIIRQSLPARHFSAFLAFRVCISRQRSSDFLPIGVAFANVCNLPNARKFASETYQEFYLLRAQLLSSAV
jgi:hypothetical protein